MGNKKEHPVSCPTQAPALGEDESLGEILDDITRERFPRHHHFTHKDVNHGRRGFMEGISVQNLLWVFISACILGVCSETLFSFLRDGHLSRTAGMLYGPFNQVYGFAAILLTLTLYKLRTRNILVIIIVSMIVGMAYEYAGSWVQEIFFGSNSWDYSQMSSNIGGRTNWLYGVGWGVIGYFYICHFWPWMSEMIGRIPNKTGKILTNTIAILLGLNLLLSAGAVWRAGQRKLEIPPTNVIERWLDKTYPDEVIAKRYPNMVFKKGP